jgi:capsular polysaccharide biosynthesis protein
MRQPVLTDPLAEHSISMSQLMSVIRRRWWIVLLLPVVAVMATYLFQRNEPFQSTVRATVLIPGDTEDTGNSERPELMVLDDLPPFIRSYAFASQVQAAMSDTDLSIDEVQSTLDGSRYSRVLTVYVTSEDVARVDEIAKATESVLPAAINDYLMPSDDSQQATVRIIDPPSAPTRDRDGHWLQLLITAALGVLIGSLIAIAVGSRDGIATQPSADAK